MKRLIFLGLAAVVLTGFAPLRPADVAAPPTNFVCHLPAGVIVPVPNKTIRQIHIMLHGDCTPLVIHSQPGFPCSCG